MNIVTWIDLSGHNLELKLVKVPSGKTYFAIMGEDVKRFEQGAQNLGFRPNPSNPRLLTREARFRDDGVTLVLPPNPDEYKKAFPDARISTFDMETHYLDRSQVDTRALPQRPAQTGGRAIGINSLGQEVFEQEDGTRYSVDERRRTHAEADADAAQAGNFLRATDAAALARCAQGFVEQAVRGQVLRAEDFSRFLEVIHGKKKPSAATAEQTRIAVEAAASAHLAKRGGRTLREAFIAATKLSDKLAFLSDGRGPAPMGPVAPMAMAAQRLLGLPVDLTDERVVVTGVGAGNLLTHLPKGITLLASDPRPEAQAAARAAAQAAGIKSALVSDAPPDVRNARAVVMDLRGEPLEEGFDGSRFDPQLHINTDLLRITNALAGRAPEGAAVFFIDEPQTEEGQAELDRFRAHLATHYHFDGEARIDAALATGRADAPARIMLAVGAARPEPSLDALPADARHIHDWSALWTWTAEVVSARSRVEAVRKVDASGEVNLVKGNVNGNDYQAPYVSASKVGKPRTMVPRNLEGAAREALARVAKHCGGDVDAWVAKEFGYTVEDLGRIFSPEQVDALALYVYAEERGRGFLNADQMGVGKGRTLAAIMRRNALKGYKTLFQTEKQQNLSDIWRDIVHTESAHLLQPMVLNDGADIIDEATKAVVHTSAPRDEVERVMNSGQWPEGVNLVLATYSQFNRKVDEDAAPTEKARDLTTAKSDWLGKAIDKNVRLVMDESHNAASMASNISKNEVKAVKMADSVVYSSATFAKGAEQMAFYAPLFPDGISSDELSSMMKKGGETFQEVLSGMLVHDGVMVRREFDLSRVSYETIIDTPRFERNRAYMDSIAPVLFELVQLSGDVDRSVRRQNEANNPNAQAQAEANERRRRVKPFHLTRMGHGSPLYSISRLFVAALKVEAVVDDAIASLKDNKKPVVVVENTVQSLLEEIAESEETAEGAVVPDFRALFHRTLRMMTQARWKDAKEVEHTRDMTQDDPILRERVEKLKDMIDALPMIPVSTIDEVKRRIRETGFTCEEITGRTLEVTDGKIMRRAASNPTVVKNAFNSGEIDAVIINVAGSTGIDLHASARFADKRPRRLYELQAPSDIFRKIQSHGRINRYDQVEDPEIISIISGLPIEMRLIAMENAKLRRMSANTTSNRDAAILTRNIPDLINPVGDIVCSRYAEVRPELMRRLGFKVEEVQEASENNLQAEERAEKSLIADFSGTRKRDEYARDESFQVQDTKRTANEVLARLIMLPVSLQERVCNELTAEFQAAIEELEARGETPLRTHDLSGIVHLRERTVFEGANVENPDSVFHEPLYAEDAALERTGNPIKVDDLLERIQIGEMASGRAQSCIDRLRSGMEEILEPFLPHGCPTVNDALERERATGGGEVTRRKAKIERLAEVLGEIKPGKQVTYTVDGLPVKGVVTRVEYPDRGYEHVPGIYGVEFVVPNDERPRTMRLGTLMNDPAFAITDGLEGNDYEKILKDFDDAVKIKLTTVQILTNNIFEAMKMNLRYRLGKLMTYVKSDGTRHRGIVVSKVHRNLKTSVPVELPTANMAWDALMHRQADLIGSNTLEDKTFSVRMLKDDTVEIRLPKKNSQRLGFIYDDPLINGLLRRWTPTSKSASPRVTVTRSEAKDIVNALYETGAQFWCSPIHREWSVEWMSKHHDASKLLPKPGREASDADGPRIGMVA